MAHSKLHSVRRQLALIHDQILNFKPLMARPPILDSSFEIAEEITKENQWLHGRTVYGLRKLKESIKIDLSVLEKFLDDPNCADFPPLSTNAPYLLAVWNEVVSAPQPIVSIFKTFNACPTKKTRKSDQGQAGVKVDIVADNGRRWIRVNTVKNSRITSEFREIDSYLTDSDDDYDEPSRSQWEGRSSLAQKEFDNSILRMGRSLLRAAEMNPVDGTTVVPKVTLRLTRLDPVANEDGSTPDPRIAQTIAMLNDMGINIEFGERPFIEPSPPSPSNASPSPTSFMPTTNINLDLSVLIALISDLTHAPLPATIEEANRRFVPPQDYRKWKQRRLAMTGKVPTNRDHVSHSMSDMPLENDIKDLPSDLITHARSLTNQLLHEMNVALLEDLYNKIHAAQSNTSVSSENPLARVIFWTTAEARDRCLRIVSKIGGVYEKRRARALFCLDPTDLYAETFISVEEARRFYWQDSRFPEGFLPLLPIQVHTSTGCNPNRRLAQRPRSPFGVSLSQVCTDILAQETMSHSYATKTAPTSPIFNPDSVNHIVKDMQALDIRRAVVTKANPRLTAHTVQSLWWGAELGWTTLTANRSSVKAILRELKNVRIAGRLIPYPDESCSTDSDMNADRAAAIWLIDPRSLAEGMSSNPSLA